MTKAEEKALHALADAWNALVACGLGNPETATSIHALQHTVMAQTILRLRPDLFNQKGQTL
jgi:hypothetical protein